MVFTYFLKEKSAFICANLRPIFYLQQPDALMGAHKPSVLVDADKYDGMLLINRSELLGRTAATTSGRVPFSL